MNQTLYERFSIDSHSIHESFEIITIYYSHFTNKTIETQRTYTASEFEPKSKIRSQILNLNSVPWIILQY